MPLCPKCGTKPYVIDSRKSKSGNVRRRYSCPSESCKFRWTEINGEAPEKNRPKPLVSNLLTEDAIRDILTSAEASVILARRYGKSQSAINQIRRGAMLANVLPEIPRRKPRPTSKLSCYSCLNCVDKRCKLGWPDLAEDGPFVAAKYCNDYEQKQNQ